VAVEEDGFDLGEEAVVAVEVGPAGLHHADGGLGEVVNGTQEPVGAGDEVGVEDGDEFAGGGFQAFLQGAGFVPSTVGAVQVDDVVAESAVAVDDELGDCLGLVGGVVEDLDFEEVGGVFEAAGGVDEAIDDELLVVDGELDGDAGELVEAAGGLMSGVLLVVVVLPDQLVAVQAIDGEDDHDQEIGE